MIFGDEPKKYNYHYCNETTFVEPAKACGMVAINVNGDGNNGSERQIGGIKNIVE